jgi:flagellar protein FlaG
VETNKLSTPIQSRPQLTLPSAVSAAPATNAESVKPSQVTKAQFADISSSNQKSLDTLLNNRKELDHALDELKRLADNSGRSLGFSRDQAVSGPVITVTDKDTGEVVRQIPTEVVVRVAHSIEKMKGLLFDKSL